ncbi:hypothetical protein AMJ83_11305 [candidate division WOR_3 bacterium SM23_42]|uniref:Secretion system C-terminal sorting domain-containing protein n=1 Tax=candidate division WOR_3 bacterium SM23_42 TaxID=1703779 RepID=A0A0S8FP23_UNCW3|nr:MAG: hypothetical protein AMJ83_11305 [candidate division WOR_3 bacterium SM23_42]
MRYIECVLLAFGSLNAVQVHPVHHDKYHILPHEDRCAALPHHCLPQRQGNAVLVDSSGNGYSAWTNIHTCLAFNPTVGGLQFVNRHFSPTGHINVHQTDAAFSFWVHDIEVYQATYGNGRYPTSVATDYGAYVCFPIPGLGHVGVVYCGPWWGGLPGIPVIIDSLPAGKCLAVGLPTENILFVANTVDGVLAYCTTNPDLSYFASGNLASNSQLWGIDCNGGNCYVFWFDFTDLSVWYRTTTDGINWTDTVQWELEYPTPYPVNYLSWFQMAVTDDGDPVLVFDVSDADDTTYPYSSKVYVSNASGATPVEVSDNTYGVWSYPTIAAGGGELVVVMQVAMDTTLLDSFARHDIFCRASADGGTTWGSAVNLTEGSTNRPGLSQCAKRVDATNNNFFYFYGVDMVENHDPFFHLVHDPEGLDPFAWYVGWHAVPTGITDARTRTPQSIRLVVYPNPFKHLTDIRYQISDIGVKDISTSGLKIYDVAGRLVKSFNLASCIPGLALRSGAGLNHVSWVRWCGDDNRGRPVPPGVYFVEINNTDVTLVQKIIRIE